MCCFWKERQRETNESVRSHFQKNARQDHGACCWRFYVSIRQPCMEGEHRNLHCECNEESEERPVLNVTRESNLHQLQHIKRVNVIDVVVVEIEHQNSQQHQHGAKECI